MYLQIDYVMGNIFRSDIFECIGSRKEPYTSENEQTDFEFIVLNIETEAIRNGHLKEG